MPTYEYACASCGSHLEVVQRFSDEPLTECPSCGGRLRKVFGSIGIAFKGSGFYKNDSRAAISPARSKDGDGDGSKGDTPKKDMEKKGAKEPSSTSGGSGSSGKAESKPAKSA